jgi:hypothetical protein
VSVQSLISVEEQGRYSKDERMNQQPIVKPGDPAKNFSLKDQNDTTFDLYENREKWTLLSFQSLAWTAFLCLPDTLPILPCYVISGRMELWLRSMGFCVRQTVFHKRANVLIDEKQNMVFC